MADCIEDKKNVGRDGCTINMSLVNQYIKLPSEFECTDAQAVDVTFWQALLLATNPDDRGYLFPPVDNVEPANEETVYVQTPITDKKVRDGKYMSRYLHSVSLCTHQSMRSHSGNGGRVALFDIEGNLTLTRKSNGKLTGVAVSLFNVEKLRINDGSNPTYSPVYIVLKDNKDIDKRGVIVDGSFVNELIPLTDVAITVVGVPTVDTFTVDVKAVCDGTGISGLVAADFVFVKSSDGTAQAKLVAESSTIPGRYVFTNNPADFVDGTLDLAAPSALTVVGYEALDPVTINVP